MRSLSVCLTVFPMQEGLKAHEGGQQQHSNPFDMFSSFFGGREYAAHDQVRKGPSSLTEFEVKLADMCVWTKTFKTSC